MFDGKTTGEQYTLTVTNNTTVIGCNVHSYSNDVVVKIPDGVESISAYAMKDCCGVQRIILPKTIKEIGQCAFMNCSDLEEVYIPETVTKLGNGIFRGCNKLKRVHIPKKLKEKVTTFERGLPKFVW